MCDRYLVIGQNQTFNKLPRVAFYVKQIATFDKSEVLKHLVQIYDTN